MLENGELITIIGFIVVWVSSIVTIWIKINIKIAELELKIKSEEDRLRAHSEWNTTQQHMVDAKFEYLDNELKISNRELSGKLDKILENLYDFKIYVEQKIR